MATCTVLIIAFLRLAITAINIMEFFLLVHIVLLWKEITWLRAFDIAGNGLVSGFTTLTDRLFCQISRRHLSVKGKVIAGLIILVLARILTGGICQYLARNCT